MDSDRNHGDWHHLRGIEPHQANPDLSRQYVQPGTGVIEAPCLTCGTGEVVTWSKWCSE